MIWIVLNPNGCIERAGNTLRPSEAVDAPPQFGMEMCGHLWLRDGEWSLRLPLDLPGDDGTDLVWSDVPEGTVFRVIDLEGGYVIGETLDTTLTLAELGDYLIEVEPPQPWLPSSVKVTR